MAHRVTPGHPEVTPGTKSYWHTSTTPSLVWQTKYVKCVRAIANHIFNTISFGDKTMLKMGNRHWHTRIDSKTAAFHPNEKSNQFCSTRPVFLSWLWTWIFRLFEQSEQSSSAWHTKFHGISNIQTWMWSTLHSYGFYDKFYFMPINPFIHFPMAHRWSDWLSFFQVFFLCFWFLPHSFQPFHKSLGSLPKNRALPRSSSTSNNSSSSSKPSSRPLQSLSRTSPGWVLTGCNLNTSVS